MPGRTNALAAALLEITLDDRTVGQFEALFVSAAPGAAPRQVQPWEHPYKFRPGKWSATDYTFELPVAGTRTLQRPRQTIILKRGRGRRLSLVPGQSLANDRLALVAVNPAGHPIARYRLSHALLVKIVGPTFDAGGNDVPIEEIVISHEGISLDWPRMKSR